MIFSRQNSEKNADAASNFRQIHRAQARARFLGVIVDKNLTWARHIITLRIKIARYIGIVYELKRFLPLKTRVQTYQSFVQSHINYHARQSGVLCKITHRVNLQSTTKGNESCNTGIHTIQIQRWCYCRTNNAILNDYDILTVQGVIVVNTLIFVHKIRSL